MKHTNKLNSVIIKFLEDNEIQYKNYNNILIGISRDSMIERMNYSEQESYDSVMDKLEDLINNESYKIIWESRDDDYMYVEVLTNC